MKLLQVKLKLFNPFPNLLGPQAIFCQHLLLISVLVPLLLLFSRLVTISFAVGPEVSEEEEAVGGGSGEEGKVDR